MSYLRKTFFLFFSFCLYLFFIASATSVLASWSSDPSVNTPAVVNSKRQGVFKVLPDEVGGAYILYVDQSDGGGIYIQRVDKNGDLPWGNEEKMLGRLQGWISAPLSIISDSNGGAIVVWEEKRDVFVHIYAQRIDVNGNLLWDQGGLLVSLNTNQNAIQPRAVSDKAGGVIIAWVYHSGSATAQVRAQRVSQNGLLMWGVDGVIIAGFTYRDSVTKIAHDGIGGVYILYRGNTYQTLLIQHVDSEGNMLWNTGGKLISDTTTSAISQYEFIGDGVGGVYIRFSLNINGVSEARYFKINYEGDFLWGEQGLTFPFSGRLYSNEQADLFVISNPRVTPWDLDIEVFKVNSDGSIAWNGMPSMIVQRPGTQFLSGFISDGDSGIVLTWYDQNTTDQQQSPDDPNEPGQADVYAQRIDSEGQVIWPINGTVVSNAPSVQVGGPIGQINESSFLIAWTDTRNGISSDDIYAQKINLDGTLGDAPSPTPEPCVLTQFPDPLLQTDATWGSVPYGGTYATVSGQFRFVPFKLKELNSNSTKKDSIAEWGCNLTSHAMNINYYAKLQSVKKADGTDFRTDPQVLNTWLQEHSGYSTGSVLYDAENNPYVKGSLVKSDVVEKYANKSGVLMSYGARVTYNASTQTGLQFTEINKNTVNNAMCSLKPGILWVKHPDSKKSEPGHFVAASGIATVSGTPTWRIHDPLEINPITLLSKYSNTFYQYQLAKTEAPKEFLTVALHSPAELIITAPDGKRTGYNPLTEEYFNEIPESSYGLDLLTSADGFDSIEQKLFEVKDPLKEEYRIQVIGTGSGQYDLEITRSNGDEIKKLPIIIGKAQVDQIDSYELTTDEVAEITRLIKIEGPLIPWQQLLREKSKLPIRVLIVGSPTFSVVDINRKTIKIGEADIIPKLTLKQDLTRDKIPDLLVFATFREIGLTKDSTEICMTAQTKDGVNLLGCDDLPYLPRR